MLSLASLVWQAATWVLSGSRVRIALRRGGLRRDAHGTARLSGPLQPTEGDYAVMRDQGFTDEVLIVDVRNVGRMPVSVDTITINTEDGWGFGRLADPENPELPHRLEPGSKQTWHVDLEALQQLVDADFKSRDAWMMVELGTGKVLRTKEATKVTPSRKPAPD
jgi:hypothetical protein